MMQNNKKYTSTQRLEDSMARERLLSQYKVSRDFVAIVSIAVLIITHILVTEVYLNVSTDAMVKATVPFLVISVFEAMFIAEIIIKRHNAIKELSFIRGAIKSEKEHLADLKYEDDVPDE